MFSPAGQASLQGGIRSTWTARSVRQVPVEEYLKLQKRYAHLFGEHPRPDIVARIQAGADHNIARFGLLPDPESNGPVGSGEDGGDV